MDILTDMMGMEVTYELWGKEASLPYYMTAGYEFKKAVIDGCPCLMLYAKEELPTLPAIKKQIARLQQLEAVPVVICVRTMSAFRRKSMIENKIPFVVLEKQVYLPFMGTFLQAKEDKTEKPIEHFMISSQLLCLLYLYQNEKKLYLSEAVKKLPYSAMTMTRAARQLEQSGIFQVEKEGVNKILTCEDTGSSLYKRMMTYMSSPVVKKGYLAKEHLSEEMVIAGTSALAEKSMLNRERVMDYAVFLEKQEADYLSDELIDPEKQILVEVWQYNPKLFARDGVADPVSVALSLREEKDERVEDTVEEMLENLWEELDGNGGFESFKRWFQGYEKQYIIIGGTACDLIMTEENLPFRATKDIDIVIIVEMLTPEFVSRFWEYVKEAGYEHQNRGTGKPEFYRFSHPRSKEYPAMLELFSRKQELMKLEEGAHLTPLPIKEDISSLSAILLNDAYYELLQSGQIFVEGVPILKPEYIIPFKAKAWLDLRGKKELGEAVDSKDIRKHRNDVFRLSVFLSSEYRVELSDEVKKDMQEFLAAMETENIDLKNLGIAGAKISDLKELLQNCYL